MVSINYSAREVCCKIVYYGPGLSGKTTNLQYVHEKIPGNTKGKLISLATEADRTLYFDFLPINIGTINGFQAKFQLYTVPGQVYYNATRKLVLRGVDGLVFVADSQPDKMDENIESLANLADNLTEYGYDIQQLPVVIQYNKRDLPGVLPVEELQAKLNSSEWKHFEASATIGNGVFDTLKMIIKLVLEKAKSASSTKIGSAGQESQSSPETPGVERVAAESEAGEDSVPKPSVAAPAVATETAVATAPAEAYRPYPGGTGKVSVTQEGEAVQPKPAPENAATQVAVPGKNETGEVKASSPSPASINQNPVVQSSTPQMAPPLRRRDSAKKRGFFKRLFGIR
ncbi:MAG: hypothetical protein JSU65_07865 [Candidatus Zixiibacteriota bacterium]|nr:MAG: hypothetical protein JSU65_07865 [candidate division Zixibacteria bacterium]